MTPTPANDFGFKKMTPQQQNEAIAKWMGVHYHKPTEDEIKSGSYYQYEPNYCGDLNAIHEATAKLGDGQYEDFTVHLARVSVGNADRGYDMRPLYEATAAHRAEALLRTLDLWVEEPQ